MMQTTQTHTPPPLTETLPASPQVVAKLNGLLSNPEVGSDELARFISLDPALSSALLRLANSAAFGGREPTMSVQQAANRLGTKRMRDVLFSVAFIRAFAEPHFSAYETFWLHSLSVALSAEIIARHAKGLRSSAAEAYLCGLVHDIGIIAFATQDAGFYESRSPDDTAEDFIEDEVAVFGADHNEGGACMLRTWGLPGLLSDVARYVERPLEAPAESAEMVKVVHIADFACNNQGLDHGLHLPSQQFSLGAWHDIGVAEAAIPEIIEKVRELTSEVTELLRAVHQ